MKDEQIEALQEYYHRIIRSIERWSKGKQHEFGNICVFLYRVRTNISADDCSLCVCVCD